MNHLARNKHQSYVAKFEQNAKELSSAQKQQTSNVNVDEGSKAKFEFELRNYQAADAESLAAHYKSDIQNGITSATAARRLREEGPNVVQLPKERLKFVKFLVSFFTGFSPLLWILVVLIFVFRKSVITERSPYNAVVIIAALCLVIITNSLIPFILDLQLDGILHRYDRSRDVSCMVVRDGQTQQIDASKLVYGDIVVLHAGHMIPADLRLVESCAMEIDGSLLTGIPQPKPVNAKPTPPGITYFESPNTVLMGSAVAQGAGRGIVVATGARTQLSKISQDCGAGTDTTVLDIQMRRTVVLIAIFAAVVNVFVVVYWAIYWRGHHTSTNSHLTKYLFSIMLATVPVGLPVSIRLGVVLVVKTLLRHGVLVKSPGNMLTMGAVSLALMDKTGILTQNKAKVSRVISAFDCFGSEDNQKQKQSTGEKQVILQATYHIAALCNEAHLQDTEPMDATQLESGQKGEKRAAIGSTSVDQGLLVWASKHLNVDELRAGRVITTIVPFSGEIIQSIATATLRNKPDRMVILAKGAPDGILPMCSYYMSFNGSLAPITAVFKDKLMTLITAEAERGNRIVFMAQTSRPRETTSVDRTLATLSGLVFVSAVAISDPPREGAQNMVEQLRSAGVLASMMTGDLIATTIAIANKEKVFTCGERRPVHTLATLHRSMRHDTEGQPGIVITGEEVDRMSEVEWQYVFKHTEIVFARCARDHKLGIVERFQKQGHIVCVTGDGVNDCSAMNRADIGISTNSGSDVAREVAEVVLLSDDITSIPKAVQEGRVMYDNLQKAVTFALVGDCWSVLIPLLLAFCLGLPNPMPIFHMVVMSCLVNVFGSVALMCENPECDVMKRKPRNLKTEHLFDWRVILHSFLYGNLIAFGAAFNYFLFMSDNGASLSQMWHTAVNKDYSSEYTRNKLAASVYFISVVVGQLLSLLSIRQHKSCLHRVLHTGYKWKVKWSILIAFFSSLSVAILFIYLPFINVYCETVSVPLSYWLIAFGWGVLWFVVFEAVKYFHVAHHINEK